MHKIETFREVWDFFGKEIVKSTLFCKVCYVLYSDIKVTRHTVPYPSDYLGHGDNHIYRGKSRVYPSAFIVRPHHIPEMSWTPMCELSTSSALFVPFARCRNTTWVGVFASRLCPTDVSVGVPVWFNYERVWMLLVTGFLYININRIAQDWAWVCQPLHEYIGLDFLLGALH